MTGGQGSPARLRLGIDLGGTKIEGIVLGGGGDVLARRRIAAPRDSYEATLEAVVGLVGDLEGDAGGSGSVGIGLPGSVSPVTGLSQGSNSTWLNGRPVAADLARRTGRPVRVANDANCFALSEAVDGAGAGAPSVFGVILGTGCGGGIVIGGRLVDGPNAISGEWGHNSLPWPRGDEIPGPACWCGRHGCMETWVSGPGLAADHERVAGVRLSAEEIALRAAGGEVEPLATLARHADRLARGLAHVVNILDPAVIVLGGGLSKLGSLYAVLPGLVSAHVFAAEPRVDIRSPWWGDAGGVRGAAWLW
jgi:fructokinase